MTALTAAELAARMVIMSAIPCDGCGADAGEPCRESCLSNVLDDDA